MLKVVKWKSQGVNLLFGFFCFSFSLDVLSFVSSLVRYWCEMFILDVRFVMVKVVVLCDSLL